MKKFNSILFADGDSILLNDLGRQVSFSTIRAPIRIIVAEFVASKFYPCIGLSDEWKLRVNFLTLKSKIQGCEE